MALNQFIERVSPAVVSIMVEKYKEFEYWSGFIVSSDGLIMTLRRTVLMTEDVNFLVQPAKLKVFIDGNRYECDLIVPVPNLDICFIRIEKKKPTEVFDHVQIADRFMESNYTFHFLFRRSRGGKLYYYSDVACIGRRPLEHTVNVITEGRALYGENTIVLQLPMMSCEYGCFGGPIFDSDGMVIGILALECNDYYYALTMDSLNHAIGQFPDLEQKKKNRRQRNQKRPTSGEVDRAA